MLESVANLKKKSKKGATAENTAFQQLFLLVGIHLFKVKMKNRKNKPATNKTSCQMGFSNHFVSPEGPRRAAGHHEGPAKLHEQGSGEDSQEEEEEAERFPRNGKFRNKIVQKNTFTKLFFLCSFHAGTEQEEEAEPEWVEVMVDILLSLLSQPSRHIRQVCKTVFSSICPHVTAAALTAILDVSNPDTFVAIRSQFH